MHLTHWSLLIFPAYYPHSLIVAQANYPSASLGPRNYHLFPDPLPTDFLSPFLTQLKFQDQSLYSFSYGYNLIPFFSLTMISLLGKSSTDDSMAAPVYLKAAREKTHPSTPPPQAHTHTLTPPVPVFTLNVSHQISSRPLRAAWQSFIFSILSYVPRIIYSLIFLDNFHIFLSLLKSEYNLLLSSDDNLASYFTEKTEAIRRNFHTSPGHISPPSNICAHILHSAWHRSAFPAHPQPTSSLPR